jgi:hypothetical protein
MTRYYYTLHVSKRSIVKERDNFSHRIRQGHKPKFQAHSFLSALNCLAQNAGQMHVFHDSTSTVEELTKRVFKYFTVMLIIAHLARS